MALLRAAVPLAPEFWVKTYTPRPMRGSLCDKAIVRPKADGARALRSIDKPDLAQIDYHE